jgi:hypothetical protein
MTSGHLRCRAVAESLGEAGAALVALTRLPASQGRSARTTNAIERLHEKCTRRITTQTVLASGEIAAIPVWVLRTFGQITLRTVDRWQSIGQPIADRVVPLAACTDSLTPRQAPSANAHHLRETMPTPAWRLGDWKPDLGSGLIDRARR